MAAKAPDIRFRGLRSPNVPTGYILGRTGSGSGEVQLLDLRALTGMGLVSKTLLVHALPPIGFGFTIDGQPGDHQLIGVAVFSKDVTFDGTDAGSSCTSLFAATSTAVFTMTLIVGGVPTIVGTITFAAGSKVGTFAWPTPVDLLAGTGLSLWAPTPADATLANITGIVIGRAT